MTWTTFRDMKVIKEINITSTVLIELKRGHNFCRDREWGVKYNLQGKKCLRLEELIYLRFIYFSIFLGLFILVFLFFTRLPSLYIQNLLRVGKIKIFN